jgi:hypothetical protein
MPFIQEADCNLLKNKEKIDRKHWKFSLKYLRQLRARHQHSGMVA